MNMLRLPSEVQFVAKGLVVIIAVSASDVSTKVAEYMARRKDQAEARGAGVDK
jgi:ribose/xylose/arabinose/galactoside ABC-type transport system permease subunit